MSWWLLEAVWTEPTDPGIYTRQGGTRVDVGESRSYVDIHDAEARRAAIRQRHPDAVVSIRPLRSDGRPEQAHHRRADPRTAIAQARHELDRGDR